MSSPTNPLNTAVVPSLVCLGTYLLYQWMSNRSKPRTEVIETTKKCIAAVKIIRKHCREMPVLGFDCEWVNQDRVSLLQLCTHKGYCALIRLCCLEDIPASLHDLLSDRNVIKIGVDAIRDAQFLQHRRIFTNSTLDLRFVAVFTGAKPQKLSAMYEAVVGKTMDKSQAFTYWDARKLTREQIEYAADDVIAAMEIYKKLTGRHFDAKTFESLYDVRYVPYYHDGLEPIKSNRCRIL